MTRRCAKDTLCFDVNQSRLRLASATSHFTTTITASFTNTSTPSSTWQQQLRIGLNCANKREHKKPKSVTPRRPVADDGSDNADQTESLFHTYSQFASKADLPSKSSDEEQHVEKELNEILEKVRTV
jgi:hypothetical protein